MLAALQHRLRAYAKLARLMMIYGGGGAAWLAIAMVCLGQLSHRFRMLLAGAPPLNTPSCGNAQCDFSMFWPAGLLARAHRFADLYQLAPFQAFRAHLLNPALHPLPWIYPPPTLLFTIPFSYLPFDPGFISWTLLLAVLAFACLRWGRFSLPVTLCALFSPAALWTYDSAQISMLAGAILGAGLMRLADAPLAAGLMLGFLVLKPQIGLLVGVALLATWNIRALIGIALSGFGLCLLSLVVLGPAAWQAYLHFSPPVAKLLLYAPFEREGFQTFGISVFWMLRSFGAGVPEASLAQTAAALASAVCVWFLWRSPLPLLRKAAVTAWLSLLATPYGYTNDMAGVLLLLAAQVEARGFRIAFPDVVIWLWPVLNPIIANATLRELGPCLIIPAALWAWRAAPGRGAPARHTSAALPSPQP